MITHMTLAVRCACGSTHQMPVDIDGMVGMICRKTRQPGKMRLDRRQFNTLLIRHVDHGNIERVYTVHRAGPMREGVGPMGYAKRQECEECGATLIAYHAPVALRDAWYTAGALVVLVDFWASYLAKIPLNALREQRCYERPS